MGHADIATTMIYVHHIPRVAAARELSDLVAAETAAATQQPAAVQLNGLPRQDAERGVLPPRGRATP